MDVEADWDADRYGSESDLTPQWSQKEANRWRRQHKKMKKVKRKEKRWVSDGGDVEKLLLFLFSYNARCLFCFFLEPPRTFHIIIRIFFFFFKRRQEIRHNRNPISDDYLHASASPIPYLSFFTFKKKFSLFFFFVFFLGGWFILRLFQLYGYFQHPPNVKLI